MRGASLFKVAGGSIGATTVVSGSGERTVLCFSGLGDLSSGAFRFLDISDSTIVACDLFGTGRSSLFPDYTPETLGQVMIEIAEQLREQQPGCKVCLIGNSFSAASAIWASAKRADLFSGSVLIGPFVRDIDPGAFKRAMLHVLMWRIWDVANWMLYYDSLFVNKPVDHADQMRALRANLKEKGRMDAVKRMLDASKSACEAMLDQVECPVLVLMGERDKDFPDPAAEAELIRKRLVRSCNVSVAMVADAGHYAQVDQPAQVNKFISAFLAKI